MCNTKPLMFSNHVDFESFNDNIVIIYHMTHMIVWIHLMHNSYTQ